MGHRNWTHEERLAAFYVYATEPFGRLHKGNPLVIRIAEQIGRTPSALAMKACNFASLDPFHTERGVRGLDRESRGDRALWDAFTTDSERVAAEATAVVESMSVGLPTEAPSFSSETEARREVVVRRAQRFFRRAVLAAYHYTCALSGIAVPELLIASHIVPWRDAADGRADPRNGIALNALYDRAFDSGLFTFDEELRVCISPKLPPDTPLMNIDGQRLRLPSRWRPLDEYLDYHRQKIFKG